MLNTIEYTMKEFCVTTCVFWLFSSSVFSTASTAARIPIKNDVDYHQTSETSEAPYYFSVNSYSFKNQFSLTLVNNSAEKDTIKLGSQSEYDRISEYYESMGKGSFFPRYSLLLQVLIFICCAAGVSAVLVLCCLICLHSLQFFSQSTVILGDDGRIRMMPHRDSHYRLNNTQRETRVHTHLAHWSPVILNTENERFIFPLERNNDLPPSYDDLICKEKDDIPTSPSPPPYSPSFLKSESAQHQSLKFEDSQS